MLMILSIVWTLCLPFCILNIDDWFTIRLDVYILPVWMLMRNSCSFITRVGWRTCSFCPINCIYTSWNRSNRLRDPTPTACILGAIDDNFDFLNMFSWKGMWKFIQNIHFKMHNIDRGSLKNRTSYHDWLRLMFQLNIHQGQTRIHHYYRVRKAQLPEKTTSYN